MTADRFDAMARAVFDNLESDGVKPLDDNEWMNPEDIEAITRPIAAAIRAAVFVQMVKDDAKKLLDETCSNVYEKISELTSHIDSIIDKQKEEFKSA